MRWLAREHAGISDAFNPLELLIPSGLMMRGAGAVRRMVVAGMNSVASPTRHPNELAPSTAIPQIADQTIRHIERYFGRVGWRGAGPLAEVERQLLKAGPGARAIVTAEHRHAFNAVVNRAGVVQYLDGQTGAYAEVGVMKAFWMLRTYP